MLIAALAWLYLSGIVLTLSVILRMPPVPNTAVDVFGHVFAALVWPLVVLPAAVVGIVFGRLP